MRTPRGITGLTIIALFLTGLPLSARSPAAVDASSSLGPTATPWMAAVRGSSSRAAKLNAAYGRLPPAFEPNMGQVGLGVRFPAHGAEMPSYEYNNLLGSIRALSSTMARTASTSGK